MISLQNVFIFSLMIYSYFDSLVRGYVKWWLKYVVVYIFRFEVKFYSFQGVLSFLDIRDLFFFLCVYIFYIMWL